jgi:hypothetical protein
MVGSEQMSQPQDFDPSIETIRTLFTKEALGNAPTPADEKAGLDALLDIATRLLVDIRRIAEASEATLKHIREANAEFGF